VFVKNVAEAARQHKAKPATIRARRKPAAFPMWIPALAACSIAAVLLYVLLHESPPPQVVQPRQSQAPKEPPQQKAVAAELAAIGKIAKMSGAVAVRHGNHTAAPAVGSEL